MTSAQGNSQHQATTTKSTDDSLPVRWGVLGAANIAIKKVIPAMQRSSRARVVAIASRDAAKARSAAESLHVERAYDSYEALLADPDIEAVYIPLPNDRHVPWTIRAAEAGKHVLCEKPIAMSAAEARTLLEVRARTRVLIGEAFMVRTHPQWIAVREMIRAGRIGTLRLIVGHFSYDLRDPANIRNRPDAGGGALMDIGCYPITLSRWLYGEEPVDVMAMIDRDPEMGIDRLTSALLRFPSGGQTSFTCGTQLVRHQSMQMFGEHGRIHVEIPFNAPPDRACRIFVDDGRDVFGSGIETLTLPVVDQYTVQADRFSDAIRGRGELPVSLEDAIANMDVIDRLFRAGR